MYDRCNENLNIVKFNHAFLSICYMRCNKNLDIEVQSFLFIMYVIIVNIDLDLKDQIKPMIQYY